VADFGWSCWVVDDAAVDRQPSVCDEDLDVGRKSVFCIVVS
jgi:hypothetical protein